MFAVTGITGKVGGHVARALLAKGLPVRAVLRDRDKAAAWQGLGCDVAIADIADTNALEGAFKNTTGVFICCPQIFLPRRAFQKKGQSLRRSGGRFSRPGPRRLCAFPPSARRRHIQPC
jgi:uncharacterized protein YbjT (DUF2867 family)